MAEEDVTETARWVDPLDRDKSAERWQKAAMASATGAENPLELMQVQTVKWVDPETGVEYEEAGLSINISARDLYHAMEAVMITAMRAKDYRGLMIAWTLDPNIVRGRLIELLTELQQSESHIPVKVRVDD